VKLYGPGRPRSERVASERFRPFTRDELVARNKANLNIIWLKDDSPEHAADFPATAVIAQKMMDELEPALAEIASIVEALCAVGE
jgi:type I restriction enzyme M protein